jgi:hypothetical protein
MHLAPSCLERDPARRGCGVLVPPESEAPSRPWYHYDRGYHGGAACSCTCQPCSAAPTQSRRSTSAWCASTASARRRCLVPSGDTCVHEQFRRAASMSPRGSTVQPCEAAPGHSRSSISSSVNDCGGLPRAAEDSVAEDAAATTGRGAAVVVDVREDCRDIFSTHARAPRRWSLSDEVSGGNSGQPCCRPPPTDLRPTAARLSRAASRTTAWPSEPCSRGRASAVQVGAIASI